MVRLAAIALTITFGLAVLGSAARAAEPTRDACYFFQLAAIDSLGRLVHEHTQQGESGPRIVQASSAMQLLETAQCGIEPALKGMNCLLETILPYTGNYKLKQAQDCLDRVRNAG